MSKIRADQSELIDRYLNNKMSEEERSEFEIKLLDDPHLLNEIQVAELLKEQLIDQLTPIDNRLATDSKSTLPPHTAQGIGDWIRQPLSLAACILIIVSGSLAFQNNSLVRDEPFTRLVPVSDVIDIGGSNRGAERTFQTDIVPSGRYNFRIDVGLERANRDFVVRVADETISDVESLLKTPVRANEFGLFSLLYEGEARSSLTIHLDQIDVDGSVEQSESIIIEFNASTNR